MSTLDWDDSYEVGIHQIDQHNKQLLERLSLVSKAFVQNINPINLKWELTDLLDYIVFHFACEEIWMAHVNYKLIAEHQEEHKRLRQRLLDVHGDFMDANRPLLRKLRSFTRSLVEHFKEDDVSFGRFLADNQRTTRLMNKLDRHNNSE